ncbi:MAG: hypothetical protein RLN62_06205 [Rickettsiales bacterium]
MALSDERTPIADYMYTGQHLDLLGRKWQEESPNNIFFYRDVVERIALEDREIRELVEGEEFPKQMIIPVNKGRNHWVSVSIKVTKDAEGIPSFDVKYSDSLARDERLPDFVNSFCDRIGAIVPGARVSKSSYEHRWLQSDLFSCGPYCLENAVRALEGIGAEPNPGRVEIRKRQLDRFDPANAGSAIKSCSRHNKIEEVLGDWLRNKRAEGVEDPLNLNPSVEDICRDYVENHHGESFEALTEIFRREYGVNEGRIRTYPLRERLAEKQIEYVRGLETVSLNTVIENIERDIEGSIGESKEVITRKIRSGSYGHIDEADMVMDLIEGIPDECQKDDVGAHIRNVLNVPKPESPGRETPSLDKGRESPGSSPESPISTGGKEEKPKDFKERVTSILEDTKRNLRDDLGEDIPESSLLEMARGAVYEALQNDESVPEEALGMLRDMNVDNQDVILNLASEMYSRHNSEGNKFARKLDKEMSEQYEDMRREMDYLDPVDIFNMAKDGAIEKLRADGVIIPREVSDIVMGMNQENQAEKMSEIAEAQDRFAEAAASLGKEIGSAKGKGGSPSPSSRGKGSGMAFKL